ncbi:FHA domain-containing protein [Ktedonobacteria bacterium brp13]|nr:FHA domain-containing protein [Ktedonobacteria bacterium brp13]
MDKCPYCGAETRQGDNFCLNCGNRLLPATPSPSQDQPPAVDSSTIAASAEDWSPSAANNVPLSNSGAGWSGNVDPSAMTAAAPAVEVATSREPAASSTVQATLDRIAEPAIFTLHSDSGEILQEYQLDKPEIVIGRAPNSDILLSKDKLTSRRHATITYEDGQYLLRDEHSANGTFVNGQQMEDAGTYTLHDGDHVGIGEHELLFHAYGSNPHSVEDLPTVAVPYDSEHPELSTYRTMTDTSATVPGSVDDYGTQISNDFDLSADSSQPADTAPHEASSATPVVDSYQSAQPAAVPTPYVEEPEQQVQQEPEQEIAATQYVNPSYNEQPEPVVAEQPAVAPAAEIDKTPLSESPVDRGEVTFGHFAGLNSPALPDMSSLTAALSSLDGQIASLQEQFNATQEAMYKHDEEVTQTAQQLRSGIRRVSERMDGTIADVARNREALAWGDLLQLMEDVMNNPRDIEYVTKLARKARELNKVFQIHQNVLNTMAECNSLLRSMIGDERQQ